MEIKINREIRDYKENIFFGLSLRQLIFSLLACGVAVGIYLGLRDALGTETVSWLCILGAVPFAAMGFVKYHGMTAEKFFAAWLRSEFLVPKRLTFRSTNLYWEAMQEQRRQEKKRPTIDEFHVVFQNPYSADFFDSAWRRFRKRGAYPTAITQNVEYLLDSVQASTMLSNSEMLILLNQAPSDREKLAALLNISPEQTSYITNAPAGCGLLRYGGALVPFKNQFPKDTELYRLMTTKPDESIIVGGKTK